MTDDFIPHGSRCEAEDGRGSDFGRCGRFAEKSVTHEGCKRYVCEFHFRHYKPGVDGEGPQPSTLSTKDEEILTRRDSCPDASGNPPQPTTSDTRKD